MTNNEFLLLNDYIDRSDKEIIDKLKEKTNSNNREEISSWEKSVPFLKAILKDLPEKSEVLLEACFGSSERADAVIVGTKDGKTVVLIIEIKHWDFDNYKFVNRYFLKYKKNQKVIPHPCVQVERYQFLLEHTNSYVQKNNVCVSTAVVFLDTKKESAEKKGPFNKQYANRFLKTPAFIISEKEIKGEKVKEEYKIITYDKHIKFEEESLLDFIIRGKINGGKKGLASDIYHSEWQPSSTYKHIISNLFKYPNKIEHLLDTKQRRTFKLIKSEVNNRKKPDKTVFIIEGASGTGKSFLAIAVLAYLYKHAEPPKNKVRCILKNRDARRACCQIVNDKDMVDLTEFEDDINQKTIINNVITCGGRAVFRDEEQDNCHCPYDCLICDEAQRMPKYVLGDMSKTNLESIINQSRVSVFFVDEKQSVSVNDYITILRIKKCAKDKKIEYSKLDSHYRCPPEYLNFVENLLYPNKKEKTFKELSNYTVKLVETPEELKNIINQKNKIEKPIYNNTNDINCLDVKKVIQYRKFPSRILAGRGKDWEMDGKIKIGDFEIGWEDRKKYKIDKNNSYWLDGDSVERAGHIDCSQGLDFNYVGVIIAEDLVYDKDCGVIKVELDNHQSKDTNLTYIFDENKDNNKYKNMNNAKERIGKFIYDNAIKDNEEDNNVFYKIWKEFKHKPENERYKELGEHLQKLLILNTYYVLLSRGIKGCYIYCCDEKLRKYLHDTLKIPFAKD